MAMPGRQYPAVKISNQVVVAGTSNSPITLYKHQFEGTPYGKPYTAAPDVIDSHLGSSSWTTSQSSFTSSAGFSGNALTLSTASPTTSTVILTLNVSSGYSFNATSFSFWNRASSTGYTNWSMTISGTTVGSGTIKQSSGQVQRH